MGRSVWRGWGACVGVGGWWRRVGSKRGGVRCVRGLCIGGGMGGVGEVVDGVEGADVG